MPFMDLSSPDRTFRRDGPYLWPTRLSRPDPGMVLQRVIVGSPGNSRLLGLGGVIIRSLNTNG